MFLKKEKYKNKNKSTNFSFYNYIKELQSHFIRAGTQGKGETISQSCLSHTLINILYQYLSGNDSREPPKDETLINGQLHTLTYIIYKYSSDNDF